MRSGAKHIWVCFENLRCLQKTCTLLDLLQQAYCLNNWLMTVSVITWFICLKWAEIRLSDPKNHAQYESKLSTLHITLNDLWLRSFMQKIKKNWLNRTWEWENWSKSGKTLAFWHYNQATYYSQLFAARIICTKN